MDVATANLVGNSVGVLLNGAANQLGTPVNYTVGSTPNAIVAGNFNADTYPDLATTNYNSHSVSVLLNNRSGLFGAAQDYPLPNSAVVYDLAIGDLTGDGRADLAVLGSVSTDALVYVFPGLSNGTFGPILTPVVLPQGGEGIAVADMNADGRLDVVVSNGRATFEVLRNAGSGSLTSVGRYAGAQAGLDLVVADFNADSRPDVAQADYDGRAVSVAMATATGFAAPTAYAAGLGSSGLVRADVNADGIADLAVSNSVSNDVTVLLGAATGTFSNAGTFAAGGTPYDLAVADLTGDGRPDLITANFVQSNSVALTVLPNAGNGRFATAASAPIDVPAGPLRMVQGDLNGDSYPDVVTVSGSPTVANSKLAVLLRQPDGRLGTAVTYPVGTRPEDVTLADINGDGHLDAVTANRGAASLSVLLNNTGTGQLTPATSVPLSGNPTGVVAADFNADGRLDLAVSGTAANTVAVLLGTASGQLSGPSYLTTGAFSSGLVATDVDGDGRLDLAVSHPQNYTIVILRNLGNGQFATPLTIPVVGVPELIFAADLTGDGRPELLTTNGVSSSMLVLRNDGTGQFQAAMQAGVYGNGLAVADLNGDAQPEVLLVSAQGNELQVLSYTNGSLIPQQDFFAAGSPRSLAVGDVNADGRPDVTIANSGAHSVTTFLQGAAFPTASRAAAHWAADLQVYPNPATSQLQIQLAAPALLSACTIHLLDATGRAVYSAKQTYAGQRFEVLVATLPRGYYILRVTNSAGQQSSRQVLLQ
ncbi:T9SS type A sorting domain-containing protein [Hymenobacter daecheongensis]|nr:T9SS type A sorting domain-containing protein [Hymenobacter daecheongensis]